MTNYSYYSWQFQHSVKTYSGTFFRIWSLIKAEVIGEIFQGQSLRPILIRSYRWVQVHSIGPRINVLTYCQQRGWWVTLFKNFMVMRRNSFCTLLLLLLLRLKKHRKRRLRHFYVLFRKKTLKFEDNLLKLFAGNTWSQSYETFTHINYLSLTGI